MLFIRAKSTDTKLLLFYMSTKCLNGIFKIKCNQIGANKINHHLISPLIYFHLTVVQDIDMCSKGVESLKHKSKQLFFWVQY